MIEEGNDICKTGSNDILYYMSVIVGDSNGICYILQARRNIYVLLYM